MQKDAAVTSLAFFLTLSVFIGATLFIVYNTNVRAATDGALTAVTCGSAFERVLYDTPSGMPEVGFVNTEGKFYAFSLPWSATSTNVGKPLTPAHHIGTSSFEQCTDALGNIYDLPISTKTYKQYGGGTPLPATSTTQLPTTLAP